jgi:hypothetical protein
MILVTIKRAGLNLDDRLLWFDLETTSELLARRLAMLLV